MTFTLMTSRNVEIRSEDDVYFALSSVRYLMKQLAFTELDQQKVLVSVSELTRNVLDHAYGRGSFCCELIGRSIRVTVMDRDPGIPHVDRILKGEKVESVRGLGLGLCGVIRLMDEVHIETSMEGTKVVAVKRQGRKQSNKKYG